jgi:hypothetical protein
MTVLVVIANFCLEPHRQLLAHQYDYYASTFFGGWWLLYNIFMAALLVAAKFCAFGCCIFWIIYANGFFHRARTETNNYNI